VVIAPRVRTRRDRQSARGRAASLVAYADDDRLSDANTRERWLAEALIVELLVWSGTEELVLQAVRRLSHGNSTPARWRGSGCGFTGVAGCDSLRARRRSSSAPAPSTRLGISPARWAREAGPPTIQPGRRQQVVRIRPSESRRRKDRSRHDVIESSVPMTMRGCRRDRASAAAAGAQCSECHAARGRAPRQCRKMALPSPGVRAWLYAITAPEPYALTYIGSGPRRPTRVGVDPKVVVRARGIVVPNDVGTVIAPERELHAGFGFTPNMKSKPNAPLGVRPSPSRLAPVARRRCVRRSRARPEHLRPSDRAPRTR